ncbi:ankyrin repeat domain-containing protein 20B-like [Ochotona curzoniae]|uniref:ankyrin repeat domain-containing protein 20B-like n=1 Tax=Ochotona curzoniae TaxID=130825 RepID=UPI001B351E7A|nr:ankyrin repeat domain-containing protein 20B-like [Ochotona curzoniae]
MEKFFPKTTKKTQQLLKSQFEYRARNKRLRKIHKAASEGDAFAVQHLLVVRACGVNDRDGNNRTALHLACAKGHVEVVNFLIGRQCLIDAIDDADMTPLMKATQCNQEKCAIILLQHGADPNHMDKNGNTALHYAIYNENTGIAKQLIQHNADIERKNKIGFTPLLIAVHENAENMVEFLIMNKARVHEVDNMDRSGSGLELTDHLVASSVKDLNLFTMEGQPTSPDLKSKNDIASTLCAQKEQTDEDVMCYVDESYDHTDMVSPLRLEDEVIELPSYSQSSSESPLPEGAGQRGDRREEYTDEPAEDSYNERNPQWAVLKEPLYDHCRTNNHESMEAELELISFYPAHDDTETTSNQEQEYLEISEYNQPEFEEEERKNLENDGMEVREDLCECDAPARDNKEGAFIPQKKSGKPDSQQLPVKTDEEYYRNQLTRIIEQYRKQVEVRRQHELTLNTLKMELTAFKNDLHQVKEQHNKIQSHLSRQESARKDAMQMSHFRQPKEFQEAEAQYQGMVQNMEKSDQLKYHNLRLECEILELKYTIKNQADRIEKLEKNLVRPRFMNV